MLFLHAVCIIVLIVENKKTSLHHVIISFVSLGIIQVYFFWYVKKKKKDLEISEKKNSGLEMLRKESYDINVYLESRKRKQ